MKKKTVSRNLKLLIAILTLSFTPMLVTNHVLAATWGMPDTYSFGLPSPSLPMEWNQTYGGSEQDFAPSVIQTDDGGYIFAGYTTTLGDQDVWIVKTDESGTMEWNKTYGGPQEDRALDIIQTSDGGYAIACLTKSFGAGSGAFWLIKTYPNGNIEWNKTYGGSGYELAFSTIQTADGYAIAGWTTSFGAGQFDFWLVKTDTEGNMVWNKTYGGPDRDTAYSVRQTTDQGYVIAGETRSFGSGESDAWLVKTNSTGSMQWNRTYGGTNFENARSAIQTPDQGYTMGGHTMSYGAGGWDFWLVKTDSLGNTIWNRTYGGSGDDLAYAGAIKVKGGGYAIGGVAGYSAPPFPGSGNFWLVETDVAGTMIWNATFGGSALDLMYSVFQTSDEGYIMAGSTHSFGAGEADAWLIKLRLHVEGTMVFFNVNPNPASVGDTITLEGVLLDASSHPLSAESVKVYARALTGSWRFITSLATSSQGIFTWQAAIPEVPAGTYIFVIYHPGSRFYEPSYNLASLTIQ